MGEGSHIYGKKIAARRDTDKGLNKAEKYAVRKLEKEIRNMENEKGYIIGASGNIIAESIRADRSSAEFDPKDIAKAKDAVLIHNHPYVGENGSLHDTLAGRIGTPFSPDDIIIAIKGNVKEVRAVTPTYVYSMRRPKGGWDENIKSRERVMEFFKDIKNYERRFHRRQNDYGKQQAYAAYKDQQKNGAYSEDYRKRRNQEINDRSNVGVQYKMMKELAKKYGFEFTRRRVK